MSRKSILCSVLLVAGSLPLVSSAKSAHTVQVTDAGRIQQARKTIVQMRKLADQAAVDASALETLQRSYSYPIHSHLTLLEGLRENINTIGKDVTSLAAERRELAPWEQQGIDQVSPLLQAAASHTNQEIVTFRDEEAHMWVPDSRERASELSLETQQIAKVLHEYLKYEDLHVAEQKAANKLPEPLAAN